MSKLLDLYRKNMETFSRLSRLSVDCTQAVARCSGQAFQQNLDNVANAIDSISTGQPSNSRIKKSAQIIQESLESNTANARELAEILTRSNREIFEVVGQRMRESVSELQDIVPASETLRKAATGKR